MDTTEKSVIPKGMIIEGNIFTDGDLELAGEVIGNVKAGNLRLYGAVKGNLDIEQKVNIEKGSTMMGEISAGETNVSLGAVCEIKMEKHDMQRSAAQFFADYLSTHQPATADDMN
ncbi:MAG: polymer-forming cytoskeletal protein [Lachnospiraceae bacterium]